MATLKLNTTGPHSDEYTRKVAAGLSECVRVLNYATFEAKGVPYPSTIYSMVGSISQAAAGMEQLLQQTSRRLLALQATGRVGVDSGGDPAVPIAAAQEALERAREAAAALTVALRDAQSATSPLYFRDGA